MMVKDVLRLSETERDNLLKVWLKEYRNWFKGRLAMPEFKTAKQLQIGQSYVVDRRFMEILIEEYEKAIAQGEQA